MCYELCGPSGTAEDQANHDAWLDEMYAETSEVEEVEDLEEEEEEEEEEESNIISERDALERFDDFLNEVYPTINICGYDYDPARALKDCDGTAYREGFNNWLDAEGLELE